MAVTKKTPAPVAPVSAKPATAAAASAPAPASVPAVAKKAPKAAAPAEVPVEAVPAAAEGGEAAAPVVTVSPIAEIGTLLVSLVATVKDVQAKLKALSKDYDRMKKTVDKAERRRANARSSPSGFAKPIKLSAEMCAFLDVAEGTEMSRTDVTRRLTQYIKSNGLNKPDNKRIIVPDTKLRKILNLTGDEEVSYFSIQRYLKHHFIKV
jgi:hypothetical protein